MNKKSKPAAAEAAPKAKARQARKSSAPKAARGKPVKTPEFDFIGKVESIGINAGAEKPALTFGLKGRNGERRIFEIPAGENTMANAIATLLTAARSAETKIGVRVGANDAVVEVQSRPRLGKDG